MQKRNAAFKRRREKNYEKLPLTFYVFCGITLVALVLYLIAVISPAFANAYNRTVGAAVRALLAHLTSFLPVSLAEILLYLLPVGVVLVAVYAYRFRCETWRSMFVFLGSILSACGLLFSLFVFGFGTGYHTDTLDQRLDLLPAAVDKESLYDTALWLVDEVNTAADGVNFGEDGFSKMPYGIEEMGDHLIAAYDPLCDRYPFVQRLDSTIKPVLASKLMSYTHITGVYSFFTGEANLNVAFPAYTLPYTAAHELAHQRGIARENEANFVAFLVTSASEDAYIRYSGYLNLLEYVAAALYVVDSAGYEQILSLLDDRVMGELRAYSAFFDDYRDSPMATVSDAVNDTYLKLHGNTEGTASYGLVVELAVAYRQAHRTS